MYYIINVFHRTVLLSLYWPFFSGVCVFFCCHQAYLMRPSIIFFDEIDGLAPVRSSRQDQIHRWVECDLTLVCKMLNSCFSLLMLEIQYIDSSNTAQCHVTLLINLIWQQPSFIINLNMTEVLSVSLKNNSDQTLTYPFVCLVLFSYILCTQTLATLPALLNCWSFFSCQKVAQVCRYPDWKCTADCILSDFNFDLLGFSVAT